MQFFVSLVVVGLKGPLLFGDYDFIKVGLKDIKFIFGDLGGGNVGKMRLFDDQIRVKLFVRVEEPVIESVDIDETHIFLFDVFDGFFELMLLLMQLIVLFFFTLM